MTTSGYIKRFDKDKLSSEKQTRLEVIEQADLGATTESGAAGDRGLRVQPNWRELKERDGVKLIEGVDNNAAIVIDNNPNKYGQAGGDNCARILLVAGFGGKKIKDGELLKQKDLQHIKNAAGIYIHQKDDVQEVFGKDEQQLVSPIQGEGLGEKGLVDKAKSHVTAFADTIQLVSRTGGINLIAGGVDNEDSAGLGAQGSIGVRLIYGNKVVLDNDDSEYSLQPMVKGTNLQKQIDQILQRIDELNAAVFGIKTTQIENAATAATHVHIPAGPIGGGTVTLDLIMDFIMKIPEWIYDLLGIISQKINTVTSRINNTSASEASYVSAWHFLN